MSRILALELNDLGVTVAGAPALADLEPSPGWAVFEPDGDRIRTGVEAAARIRLNPRLAHRDVWGELELTPLPSPFPRGLSTADLAYAHLRSIWEGVGGVLGREAADVEGRLLVAPASFSVERLGLVLGIAESLELPFTGVVDAAVAAAATASPEPSVVLDLELGRSVATEVGVALGEGESRIGRRHTLSQQGAGWNALLDAWARAVGRAFVRTTRFDPLHTARSEQELYRLLPEWLGELAERETIQAVMRAGDREHAIVLTRREIVAAAEPVYARIVELGRALADGAPALAVSHRLERAPGLLERLADAGFSETRVLARGAALDGALRHAGRLHQPSVRAPLWVTELPAGEAAPASTGSTASGRAG